jgi:hypothetical protein
MPCVHNEFSKGIAKVICRAGHECRSSAATCATGPGFRRPIYGYASKCSSPHRVAAWEVRPNLPAVVSNRPFPKIRLQLAGAQRALNALNHVPCDKRLRKEARRTRFFRLRAYVVF